MFCTFGEIIKEIRKDKNLTIIEMSKILNIDNSLLGKIENNLRNPSDDLINIFSKRFNIDLNMLIVASQSDKMVEFLKRSPQELKDKILESFINKIHNEVKRASK